MRPFVFHFQFEHYTTEAMLLCTTRSTMLSQDYLNVVTDVNMLKTASATESTRTCWTFRREQARATVLNRWSFGAGRVGLQAPALTRAR